MKNQPPSMLLGIVFIFTVHLALKELNKNKNLRSELISVKELNRLQLEAFAEAFRGVLNGDDHTKIQERFEKRMKFITSVTYRH